MMGTSNPVYIRAGVIAMGQGGTGGLARSLFASLVPKHKASEFFGVCSVVAKVAGIFGPLVFALVSEVTGAPRQAILSVIAFFVVGGILLARVDVAEGQRLARAVDTRTV